MPRTLKRAPVAPFASTSSLPTLTRPLYSSAIASTVGAIARHGAHQAAQKSTKTGVLDFRTSFSKLPSVISIVFAHMNPPKKNSTLVRQFKWGQTPHYLNSWVAEFRYGGVCRHCRYSL